MFQNINEDTIELNKNNARGNKEKLNIFTNVFNKKYIIVYLISFMLSLVNLNGEFSIFSISILGACLSFSVPALGIVAVSLVGNLVKFGINGVTGYFLTAAIMILSILVIKPYINENERNEKIKLGKNVFIGTLILQLINAGISGFTLYDILSGITLSIIALVFYKIFVNSIVVMKDFKEKKAFSIEEVIGASLLLAIAASGFGDLNIFGFGIRNILSILIVMILGWKNGILVGTTSGVTIGVTLGAITGTDTIMIAAYAISGMIAGILNRFGKAGVVIGFTLGNIVLAYVSNGNTIELIHFKEILIASIGLLAVPKTFQLNLEEFIGNPTFLPVTPERTLNNSKNVAQNLNNMSQAINEMARGYRNIEGESTLEQNKDIFIAELLNTLEPYKDNMIYDDIANTEGKIIEDIFYYLIDKQEMTVEALLTIFADCNSYIVGTEDKEISKYLKENLTQMVRIINMSYKVSKSEFIWRKKAEENKKNIGKQLKDVSKAIQGMVKEIEKDIDIEEEYEKEKREIILLIQQKGIEIKDIIVKKENRYIVEIYLDEVLETAKIETIESILSKIFYEKIVLNEDTSTGTRLNFLSDDKYQMTIGKSNKTKTDSDISGDNILTLRLKDGKYLVAISDGMGSGKEADKSSKQALRLLENLLLSGFDKKISLELINTALINQNPDNFATLDIAIVDLYMGNIEFIKSGACPTYIKNKKRVQLIKSTSLPAGIIEENNIQTFDRDIQEGDILVLCSDGVLDSNIAYKNKELWVKYILEDIETENTQKISDLILNEAIDNNYGNVKDDMSIIVCKFKKK